MVAKEFVSDYIHSVYAEEKLQVLETLKIFNPYTDEYEELDFFEIDEEQEKEAQLESAIAKVLGYETLDLGLARSVIRSGKRSGLSILVTPIVGNFHFFAPVINDVALYLQAVTDEELAESLIPAMEELVTAPQFISQLARYWLEWYPGRRHRFRAS